MGTPSVSPASRLVLGSVEVKVNVSTGRIVADGKQPSGIGVEDLDRLGVVPVQPRGPTVILEYGTSRVYGENTLHCWRPRMSSLEQDNPIDLKKNTTSLIVFMPVVLSSKAA